MRFFNILYSYAGFAAFVINARTRVVLRESRPTDENAAPDMLVYYALRYAYISGVRRDHGRAASA